MNHKNFVRCGLSLVTAMCVLSVMIFYLGTLGCTFFGFEAIDFLVAVWGFTGGIVLLAITRGKKKGRYRVY